VVVVVLDLLANGGVSAVTTPAIARRIGIAQSALFKHFPNKEAIWRAVMETIALEVGARLAGAAAESGTHEERIFAILAAYLSAVIDIPAIPALLFSGEVQTPGRASYLRTEISKRFGWFHAALRDQLFVGQRSGAFRRDFDPDAAASLAAGIAQSAVLRWRLGGGEVDMIAEAHRAFPLFLAAIERHQGV
jgi:AcrR family transcriptional regulator